MPETAQTTRSCPACGLMEISHVINGGGKEQFVGDKCVHAYGLLQHTHDALGDWNTEHATIVDQRGQDYFVTTTKNTGLFRRDTLEQSTCNLVSLVGADTVHRRKGSRGNLFTKFTRKASASTGVRRTQSSHSLAR